METARITPLLDNKKFRLFLILAPLALAFIFVAFNLISIPQGAGSSAILLMAVWNLFLGVVLFPAGLIYYFAPPTDDGGFAALAAVLGVPLWAIYILIAARFIYAKKFSVVLYVIFILILLLNLAGCEKGF